MDLSVDLMFDVYNLLLLPIIPLLKIDERHIGEQHHGSPGSPFLQKDL